ncbi:GHMP family kinase ATP-binding protein [Halopelagius longus]|uniref:Pantoate kinase n=1 Tax=Halopelagius longus TaxID=1236180 RepID=A0A370IMY6_9EURY|nr:GHMP kinase [Halopelagius longus]RDI72073.1 GHMP kinase [Halopelagius longus]
MTERAYAPGSVTVVFVPQDDPEAGSLGVSFAVEDGVTATVEAAAETVVRLDGDRTDFEPVERLLSTLDVSAAVELDAAVPVGRGFGASGAATLATALAANEAFGLDRSRESSVRAAHRAEVAAGTGLGDVFVQDRGGVVWNTGDGVERAEPGGETVEYASYGGISTASVLGDEEAIAAVAAAGREALSSFDPDAPLPELFESAWRFADESGLPTDAVRDTVADVAAAGGAATMAMVGETVLAVGAPGVLPNRTRLTGAGAKLR